MYAKFLGIGDALDPVLMANCPTQSEFAVIDVTVPANLPLVELYKANKKLCAIIALGQGKSHGMALLGKTKCDDYPNGLAWEFVAKAKKANKPSDASTIIELEVKLDKLQLKSTRDFYNEVVGVIDKYEVTKTNCQLCMLMVQKNNDVPYARLILDKLKSSSPDFDRLCNDVLEIQRLAKSGSNHVTGTMNCIFLPLKVKDCSKENVVTAARYVDSNQKSVRNTKGIYTVVAPMVTVGAIQKLVAPTRHVISVA